MSSACACSACDREFSSMEAFWGHICQPAESWYDRARRELDITDGCLVVCGACGAPLPDEEHGEAGTCLLRTPIPTVEPSPTVDPPGAGTMEAAGLEPALTTDRKRKD